LKKIPKCGLRLDNFPLSWHEFYITIPTYCDEKSSQYLKVSTNPGHRSDIYETMLPVHYYDGNGGNYNINQQCTMCHSVPLVQYISFESLINSIKKIIDCKNLQHFKN